MNLRIKDEMKAILIILIAFLAPRTTVADTVEMGVGFYTHEIKKRPGAISGVLKYIAEDHVALDVGLGVRMMTKHVSIIGEVRHYIGPLFVGLRGALPYYTPDRKFRFHHFTPSVFFGIKPNNFYFSANIAPYGAYQIGLNVGLAINI